MRTNNVQIVTSAAMTEDLVSSYLYLDQIIAYGVQAVWTAGPTGTLKIQVSIDVGIDLAGDGVVTWSDVSGSEVNLAGIAGNFYWDLSEIIPSARWARLVYTFTSGTGTLNARQNLKGF